MPRLTEAVFCFLSCCLAASNEMSRVRLFSRRVGLIFSQGGPVMKSHFFTALTCLSGYLQCRLAHAQVGKIQSFPHGLAFPVSRSKNKLVRFRSTSYGRSRKTAPFYPVASSLIVIVLIDRDTRPGGLSAHFRHAVGCWEGLPAFHNQLQVSVTSRCRWVATKLGNFQSRLNSYCGAL